MSKKIQRLHHNKILNGTSIEKFHLQTVRFCLRSEFYNFYSTNAFHKYICRIEMQECILRFFANVRFDLQKTKHGPASLRLQQLTFKFDAVSSRTYQQTGLLQRELRTTLVIDSLVTEFFIFDLIFFCFSQKSIGMRHQRQSKIPTSKGGKSR